MKTYALCNQKGGVGKTTTTLSVGAALADQGYKVLLIDADPQGNLTISAGIDLQDGDTTVYEVLKDQVTAKAAIKPGAYDVLPADIALSGADIELSNIPGRELLLKEALEPIKADYDYILIDCPPSLSLITLMALTAADGVIVPVQAHYLAMQGIKQLTDTISLVKRRMNPQLDVAGVLITQYGRSKLNRDVLEAIQNAFPGKVYKTQISNNIALAEAPSYGKDVMSYKPKSKGAEQYKELAKEIIERG